MGKKHVVLTLTILVWLVFFGVTLAVVIDAPWVNQIDTWAMAQLVKVRPETTTNFLQFFSKISGPSFLLVISLLISAYIVFRYRHLRLAGNYFIANLIGMNVLPFVIKFLVDRPRPENGLVEVLSASYPSAHAASATVFFGLLFILIYQSTKQRGLICGLLILFFILAIFIMWTRLYLNVHYMTDILGGFFLGLAWISLVYYLIQRR